MHMRGPEGFRDLEEDVRYPCMFYVICGNMISAYSESVFASLMCDSCRQRLFGKKRR